MRTSSYTIDAGARVEIAASGNYVRVRKSAVELIIENGESNEHVEVSEGDDFQFKPFKNLYVTNTGATKETIKLTISRDQKAGSAKVGGSVAIVGAVELGAASLGALESIDLNAATRDLLRFEAYGASYNTNGGTAANVAEVIFSPAANVNGAIIHSAQISDGNTTGLSIASIVAKATTPSNVSDGDAILSADASDVMTGLFVVNGSLKNPLKIPAGKGLFFVSNIVQSTAKRSVLYTLL